MKIVLQNIQKAYGSRRVLDGLDLSVESGEVFVILGESGAGKTTLLRLIAGLERPDKGFIRLGDVAVCGNGRYVEPHERNVGLIFQDLALWPHLTVEKNCDLVMRDKIRKKSDRKTLVHAVLSRFRIAEFAGEYPHTLSAGERQRASLARAYAAGPRALLLDEPLTHLDVHLKKDIMGIICEINESMGVTIVYVTHEPEEARLLGAKSAGILSGGKVIGVGDVDTTLDTFLKKNDNKNSELTKDNGE
jgi:iron(III) transport system ATP-binding protein